MTLDGSMIGAGLMVLGIAMHAGIVWAVQREHDRRISSLERKHEEEMREFRAELREVNEGGCKWIQHARDAEDRHKPRPPQRP